MPEYIYHCQNCGEITVKHKIGKNIEKCPQCGRKGIKRVFTPPMIRFVGDGFYVNDKKK